MIEMKTDWFAARVTRDGTGVWIDGHGGYSTADALALPLAKLPELIQLLRDLENEILKGKR